jgi:predicted AAA+ superfamily ATPase
MNAMDHHEAWEMKPRKLSIEEIEQPERVIEEFFQFAHLPQVRWYMWELMKTLVTGGFPEIEARERTSLVCFYEQLEKLIEGVHVLRERIQHE